LAAGDGSLALRAADDHDVSPAQRYTENVGLEVGAKGKKPHQLPFWFVRPVNRCGRSRRIFRC
jgi:hypothetical protein